MIQFKLPLKKYSTCPKYRKKLHISTGIIVDMRHPIYTHMNTCVYIHTHTYIYVHMYIYSIVKCILVSDLFRARARVWKVSVTHITPVYMCTAASE